MLLKSLRFKKISMSIFSQLFANTENSYLPTLVSEGAFLIDVRTSEIYFRAKWNYQRNRWRFLGSSK